MTVLDRLHNGTKWRHIDGKSRTRYTFEANGGLKFWRTASNGNHFFTAEVDGRSYDFYANGWTDVEVETLKMSDLHKIRFWCYESDRQGSSGFVWMTLLKPGEQHSDVVRGMKVAVHRRDAAANVAARKRNQERKAAEQKARLKQEQEEALKATVAAAEADPFEDIEVLLDEIKQTDPDKASIHTRVVQEAKQLEANYKVEAVVVTPEPTPSPTPEPEVKPVAAAKSVRTTKGYERGSRLHLQFTTIQRDNLRLFWEEYGFPEVGHNNMEKWFADIVYRYFMDDYDPKQGGLVKARLRSERLASDG